MAENSSKENVAAANKILSKMLDRLYAAISSGPSLNCRPHSSRQRFDLSQLTKLDGRPAQFVLNDLLSEAGVAKIIGKAIEPPASWKSQQELTDDQKSAINAWADQQLLVRKLRVIAEDSKTYEQDTGAHVLYLGYPLLSVPPRSSKAGSSKRVIAPIAFIPLELEIKSGRVPSLQLTCADSGMDRVVPNSALLAWVEKQSGARITDLFADDEGNQPWREINGLVTAVCKALEMAPEAPFGSDTPLQSVPKSDGDAVQQPCILPAAVLGLFPMSNQGLLQDMIAMAEGEELGGPVRSFVRVDEALEKGPAEKTLADQENQKHHLEAGTEYLVSAADPCQSRAVRLARKARGLVVHGPPGTGKSQTITNIIGDHLARGERVLFVCDKRTALDVVLYRLESLGLQDLCAVVHDPQRDQRELYMGIRKQLDELPDKLANPRAKDELQSIDKEIKSLHAEMLTYFNALQKPDSETASLNQLVGMWLAERHNKAFSFAFDSSSIDELKANERDLAEVFKRANAEDYSRNPWRPALGISLGDYMAVPPSEWRTRIAELLKLSEEVDATSDSDFPAYADGVNVLQQAQTRSELADELAKLYKDVAAEEIARWAKVDSKDIQQLRKQLVTLEASREMLRSAEEDAEMQLLHGSSPNEVASISVSLATLKSYLEISNKWYGFLFISRKTSAGEVLKRYGLTTSTENAGRVEKFLSLLRAQIILSGFYRQKIAKKDEKPPENEALLKLFDEIEQMLKVLSANARVGEELAKHLSDKLSETEKHQSFLSALKRSVVRAKPLQAMIAGLEKYSLVSVEFKNSVRQSLLRGECCLPLLTRMEQHLNSVESILRMKQILSGLPAELNLAVTKIVEQEQDPEMCMRILRHSILTSQIGRRLKSKPELQRLDGEYFRTCFERYRQLQREKSAQARETALAVWIQRQKESLLASTGSRLNGSGAELRRRLFLRGQKAMRLRQVVAAGSGIEGGDPLFDARPVWMASPETVAQIFPRMPIFDVVIFDEASQCRLEEAIPVLTRAHRVVIAGDPKQLPPTRFFETAVAQSDQVEAETDQELFEEQQSEVEDLLSAALNLEVEQSYLDVHYRSQNADLIQFSNSNFYDSRLQPIPAHPSHRAAVPPLKLIQVHGTYEDRVNKREAAEVVTLVKELLSQERPPSIGVACFNLAQRDEIVEALEAEAAQDSEFASAYRAARVRRGSSAFEGLFVKNLENVQGDERDHIIISSTYGPDPKGKFYRRFGPLAMAGGGRRLNVLVTRARQAVHLITSIPREIYSAVEQIPTGSTPNGAYLLFAYLRYAELLVELYDEENKRLAGLKVIKDSAVNCLDSRNPSAVAQELAKVLSEREAISSDVHWGNEGFCVDVALHHPSRPEDVTIGLICDGTRYAKTEDPVEWDVFRTSVLESQGWQLLRLLSPNLFRDIDGTVKKIAAEAQNLVAKQIMDGEKTTAASIQ